MYYVILFDVFLEPLAIPQILLKDDRVVTSGEAPLPHQSPLILKCEHTLREILALFVKADFIA